jgi:hypothetical protein
MENDKFDRETINKYLEILEDKNHKVDLHLLEYVAASYLIYDVEKRDKPIEENEEFIRANKVIEEFIAQGELNLTESKMLLSLQFVLESSFVAQYL